ncbi:MAG: transposase, partial [Sulfurimonas sp.]|nr:transposase [Sulfurimonas sp.]
YLDSSQKGSYLNGDVLMKMSEFLKSRDNNLYELIAYTIMPNHIHILIKPLDKLALVVKSIKGSSAKMINDILKRRGKFWANDYYDKTIRDEKHFQTVYNYIKNNPLKLGETEVSLPRFYGIYE